LDSVLGKRKRLYYAMLLIVIVAVLAWGNRGLLTSGLYYVVFGGVPASSYFRVNLNNLTEEDLIITALLIDPYVTETSLSGRYHRERSGWRKFFKTKLESNTDRELSFALSSDPWDALVLVVAQTDTRRTPYAIAKYLVMWPHVDGEVVPRRQELAIDISLCKEDFQYVYGIDPPTQNYDIVTVFGLQRDCPGDGS